MSENKKYYYIKLKVDYFKRGNMNALESMENGYIYSNIILKMYLTSAEFDGQLMMTDKIPYDITRINYLANAIGHDVGNVKEAINHGVELGLLEITDSGTIWMSEIQKLIGHSSNEADRIRNYRKKIKANNTKIVQTSYKRTTNVQKRTPELEIELEIDINNKQNKYKYLDELTEYWNSLNVIVHDPKIVRKYWKHSHHDKVSSFSLPKIRDAMKNYKTVITGEMYYYTHRFSMWDFVNRSVHNFLPEASPLENYLSGKSTTEPSRDKPITAGPYVV